jgi:hypothetical protein
MSAKFFITHSWHDVEFARRLTDDLRRHGLDGFFDLYAIKPGDNVVSKIDMGLKECDVYVPILSRAALKSPWCEEEINSAIMMSKQPTRVGKPRIIPVLIEDCASEMPVMLQTRLYLQFNNDYDMAFRDLLERGFGIAQVSEPALRPKPSLSQAQASSMVTKPIVQEPRVTETPASIYQSDAPQTPRALVNFMVGIIQIVVATSIVGIPFLLMLSGGLNKLNEGVQAIVGLVMFAMWTAVLLFLNFLTNKLFHR